MAVMLIDIGRLKGLIKSQGFSQVALAAAAGMSRPALHALLAKEKAEVRARTLRGLVRALKLADEGILLADPFAGYKKLVAEAQDLLDFRGLGLPHASPLRLDELYVPVRLRSSAAPDRQQKDGCNAEHGDLVAAKSGEPSTSEDVTELTVAQCLHRHPRILLHGEPGSGKTTSLRHLARSYALDRQQEDGYPGSSRLPLFIRLADFARACRQGHDLDMVAFVVARTWRLERPDPDGRVANLLKEELRRGGCLVLLDGWDEVPEDTKAERALRQFVKEYPDNQFVVSSRTVGQDFSRWRQLGFQNFDMGRWREEDVATFALRWCASRHGHRPGRKCKDCERRAVELLAAILAHPGVRAIATNPLMLTILAALHHANVVLPRRRADLYAKVAEVLLDTWEAAKRAALPGDPEHGMTLEAREFGWLLAALALAMQREGRVLRPRSWVTQFVQDFLSRQLGLEANQAKDQSDRILRHLCERSGLLVERGPDVFGFSHLTFQEYFAARGILDEAEAGPPRDVVGLLRPYLYHSRWAEVVRLVSAKLSAPQATALVRSLLDDPDPVGRFLRRGPLLALRCLADGAAVTDRQLISQLFLSVATLSDSPWLGITNNFLRALSDLKGTRVEAAAEATARAMLESAKARLEQGEFLYLYLAYEPLAPVTPAAQPDTTPGKVRRGTVGGCPVRVVMLGRQLKDRDPGRWYAAVFALLRGPARDVSTKVPLIEELEGEAATKPEVRRVFEDLLQSDRSAAVRVACARALGRVADTVPSVADLLRKCLRKKGPASMRRACAAALRKVAPVRPEVQAELVKILGSSLPDEVRAGAARGLAEVVLTSPAIRRLVLKTAQSAQDSPVVRNTCLLTLAEGLREGTRSEIVKCLTASLDDAQPPAVRRMAAQELAEAVADGTVAWARPVVERVEHILLNLRDPCPHALRALERLVEAREQRAGLRLEGVLRDALRPLDAAIAIAFVFGSVARKAQQHDSDIDLLVIGDVRLRDLAGPLRAAEQILGRAINPALYTPRSFREKSQAGDPFLTHVCRHEKLFLKGGEDDLGELVAERLSCQARADRG
jgi:predicted nucleotidyltransferase